MRARAALLLVLCLLSLAGCAERQSEKQYEETIKDVRGDRLRVLSQLRTASPDDEAFFTKAAKRMQVAADDLEAVAPPRDVQTAHDTHVEGLRGLAKVLRKYADCARLQRQDMTVGARCRQEIDELSIDEVRNDFDEADTIYRDKGYDLGSEKAADEGVPDATTAK